MFVHIQRGWEMREWIVVGGPQLALQLSRACCPNDVQRLPFLFLLFGENFISLLVCFVLYLVFASSYFYFCLFLDCCRPSN